MQKQGYTLVFLQDARGRIRRLTLPSYLVTGALVFVFLLAGLLLTGTASYLHLTFKMADYEWVRAQREELRRENLELEANYDTTREKLLTLESLASEVATTYGLLRLRQTPFGSVEEELSLLEPEEEFRHTLARYRFLQRHATAVTLYASGVRPLPGQELNRLTYTPSLWPVRGPLMSGFGQRLDPFNGEGSFHGGVDIRAQYGEEIRAAADGFVVAVGRRRGYGRVVVLDHGGGLTTWYAHLSGFRAYPGQSINRGDVIGYAGNSGRSTSPHLHYEIRLRNTPLNPWRFLRTGRVYASRSASLSLRGGD